MSEQIQFADRGEKQQIEQGLELAPKFDANGLIPAIATDYETGTLLMVAYMNEEALKQTVALGEAVYYSRSRQELWHKGATSGHVQIVKEIRVDCDQDAIWLRVDQQGKGACHVGYQSCFYRAVDRENLSDNQPVPLVITETEKSFDPKSVYK
ncbi:phosphoribosyl-AMP cyclohydrolase [Rubinisphaera italica]|uniref:Phosphoribosyl-AMP cyclohydrolase n=1 Tax=Rubinisphaera italica TaxID=2527969 RepID=A0A5C5XIN4_9PLAN|nr:phosphoribosyl-AMP cyclohydrolase [Rubinisphaera italica]TWT63046.1 phosphoribosyl-AMP cyclohydrolase [Rubinisphaera italica]